MNFLHAKTTHQDHINIEMRSRTCINVPESDNQNKLRQAGCLRRKKIWLAKVSLSSIAFATIVKHIISFRVNQSTETSGNRPGTGRELFQRTSVVVERPGPKLRRRRTVLEQSLSSYTFDYSTSRTLQSPETFSSEKNDIYLIMSMSYGVQAPTPSSESNPATKISAVEDTPTPSTILNGPSLKPSIIGASSSLRPTAIQKNAESGTPSIPTSSLPDRRDENGCMIDDGFSWCPALLDCINPSFTLCPKKDPTQSTSPSQRMSSEPSDSPSTTPQPTLQQTTGNPSSNMIMFPSVPSSQENMYVPTIEPGISNSVPIVDTTSEPTLGIELTSEKKSPWPTVNTNITSSPSSIAESGVSTVFSNTTTLSPSSSPMAKSARPSLSFLSSQTPAGLSASQGKVPSALYNSSVPSENSGADSPPSSMPNAAMGIPSTESLSERPSTLLDSTTSNESVTNKTTPVWTREPTPIPSIKVSIPTLTPSFEANTDANSYSSESPSMDLLDTGFMTSSDSPTMTLGPNASVDTSRPSLQEREDSVQSYSSNHPSATPTVSRLIVATRPSSSSPTGAKVIDLNPSTQPSDLIPTAVVSASGTTLSPDRKSSNIPSTGVVSSFAPTETFSGTTNVTIQFRCVERSGYAWCESLQDCIMPSTTSCPTMEALDFSGQHLSNNTAPSAAPKVSELPSLSPTQFKPILVPTASPSIIQVNTTLTMPTLRPSLSPMQLTNDRDSNGCVVGAGFVWCEALNDCILPTIETCPSNLASPSPRPAIVNTDMSPSPTAMTNGSVANQNQSSKPTTLDDGKDEFGCVGREGSEWCASLKRCISRTITDCPKNSFVPSAAPESGENSTPTLTPLKDVKDPTSIKRDQHGCKIDIGFRWCETLGYCILKSLQVCPTNAPIPSPSQRPDNVANFDVDITTAQPSDSPRDVPYSSGSTSKPSGYLKNHPTKSPSLKPSRHQSGTNPTSDPSDTHSRLPTKVPLSEQLESQTETPGAIPSDPSSSSPGGSPTSGPSQSAKPTVPLVPIGESQGDTRKYKYKTLALAFVGFGTGMLFGVGLILFSLYRSYTNSSRP